MFSHRWGHGALSMPILVESSPRVASLCQKPTEDLIAWKMCNSLFLLRNPASFMEEEVKRCSFSLRSWAQIPPFTACPLKRAPLLCSQSLFLQYFSGLVWQMAEGRAGTGAQEATWRVESTWRVGKEPIWEVGGPRDTWVSVSTDTVVSERDLP